MRFDEDVLRDILGIFALPEYAISDAKCQNRRFGQQCFELAFELGVHRYESAGRSSDRAVHPFTKARRRRRSGGSLGVSSFLDS